jgi:hypothetical protein
MASRTSRLHLAWLGMGCALVAMPADANEIGVFGLIGTYRTDNGMLTNTGVRADNVGWLSLGTYGNWESGRLRTRWNFEEDGIDYFNGSYGTKAYTSGWLKFDFNALPQFMTWHVFENTGQILVTPTAPDTPLNRANFNVFSTGPSLHVPVTGTTWVGSDALYSKTYYAGQTLNGDKWDVDLGFNKNLDLKTDLGVYVGQTQGTYKALGIFQTESANVRFVAEGAFTSINAQAGANRAVEPFSTHALPSFDLSVVRKFRQTSSLVLKLQRKITNPSETFAQLATGSYGPGNFHSGVDSNDIANTVSLYDSYLARFGYETRRGINEVKVGASYRKEDTLPGEIFVSHRRIQAFDAMYHRIWGSKVGITVYGIYEVHKGELLSNETYREWTVGTEVARPIWTVATRWVLTFDTRRRRGDDALNNYQEYRIGAYLRFSRFIFNQVKE